MKKMAFIINSGLVNAGVPKVCFDIFNIIKDEYECSFIVESSNREFYDDKIIKNGGKIFYLGKYKSYGRKKILYNLVKRKQRLQALFNMQKFDVIHSCSGIESGLDCLIAAKCGIKKRIVHSHGCFSYTSGSKAERIYKKICFKYLSKYATNCVAVSEKTGKSLFCTRTFDILLNPVDVDLYSCIVSKPHDGLNLLQIGYFNSNKNQMFSVSVLNEVIKMGKDATLYLIGYEIELNYRRQLEEYISFLGITESVVFLPHDFDKSAIFPIIDYVMIPSLSEGMPLVALEAQAAHVECIVSEAVTNEANVGLLHLIKGYDSNEWARRMVTHTFDDCECFHNISDFSLLGFKTNVLKMYSG